MLANHNMQCRYLVITMDSSLGLKVTGNLVILPSIICMYLYDIQLSNVDIQLQLSSPSPCLFWRFGLCFSPFTLRPNYANYGKVIFCYSNIEICRQNRVVLHIHISETLLA